MAIGFFDGDKANASPESIKRKREMIARLMSGGRAPRNIGEGFSAIGDGIASAMLGYRADSAEQAGNAERSRIMAGAFGGGAPMAAVGGAPVATGSATGSGATSAPVSGKGYDNPQARETYEYAIAQGLAPHQAAAYTGAKLAESRFNPNARNPGDGRDGSDSIGGFQWNSGRAQALKQFAAQQGKSWNDPAVQRAFSFAELNGSERAAGQALRNAKTPEEATAAMLSYLRPGGWTSRNPLGAHSAPARLRNTQGILSAFGNMPVVQPGPGAAPMPLARQQAETAPMPMAGPQGNEGLAQDGAGELQAGGSGLMAEPAVYRDQLNNVPAGDLMQQGPMPALPPGFDVSSLITPAGQPSVAQGFADNEDQTRIMEAQMAAEQGLPYAGNDPALSNQSDVFSPIPMGLGGNPFMPSAPVDMAQAPVERPPMDRATFDQITSTGAPLNPAFMAEGIAPSWGGQNADVAAPGAVEVAGPRQVQAPMPPPRPADLGPQSPFVPPAMRQPMPVDMGGENGASPMQFIESEFARREGRPDPRMAMGAPMAQAPQMPAGAPPMPVGGQSAPMGGEPAAQAQAQAQAQAPAQRPGMIPERDLVAVLSSRFTTPEDKRFAMDLLNQQRATQQAEAERARTQQANEAAARAAGIDPALLGNQTIAAAAAKARFDRMSGNTKRSLQPVFATDAQGNTVMLQPGEDGTAVQTKMPDGVKIASGVDKVDAGTEFILIDKRTGNVVGRQPKDIAGAEAAKVVGKNQGERVVNAPGEIRVADGALKTLEQIRTHPGRDGWGAQGSTASLPLIDRGIPGTAGRDFVALVEQAQGQAFLQAFESLKGGGQITETEGKAATAAIARLDRTQSREGFNVALKDIEEMLKKARDRAQRRVRVLPDGTEVPIGQQQPTAGQPSAQQAVPAQSGGALQAARDAIAKGADRQKVIDRLRQNGIDPGGL